MTKEGILSKLHDLGYSFSRSDDNGYVMYHFIKEEEEVDYVNVVEIYRVRNGDKKQWRIRFELKSSIGRDIDWNGFSLSNEEMLLFSKLMEEVSK